SRSSLPRGGDPRLLEQCVGLGRTPAERDERVERLAAAADAENALAKALGRRAIEHAGFLERGERVGCEDLGPLVAVIARRVAAAENVAESAWEAVVGRRLDDGDLVADLVEQ